jgi:hypothetical protein
MIFVHWVSDGRIQKGQEGEHQEREEVIGLVYVEDMLPVLTKKVSWRHVCYYETG